jgi:ATP-binding cassette subfamily B protein RaxB
MTQDHAASLSPIIAELARHGLNARQVELTVPELQALRLPTLIQLRSGAAVLLLKMNMRRAQIGCDDGRTHRISCAELERRFAGSALDLSPALPARGHVLRRLVGLLREHAYEFLHAFGVGLLILAVTATGPALSRLVVDHAYPNYDLHLLATCVLGTIVLGIHGTWLGWVRSQIMLRFQTRVEVAIQRGVFEHSLRIPLSEAQSRSVGTFLETLQTTVGLAGTVIGGLLAPLIDLVMGAGYLVLLAMALPSLAALAAAMMLVSAIATIGFGLRLALLRDAQQRARATQYSMLHELLSGAFTLKALGAERQGMRIWTPRLFGERAIDMESGRLAIWMAALGSLCEHVIHVGTLYLGGLACLDGTLTLGGFMAVVLLEQGFIGSIGGAAGKLAYLLTLPAKLKLANDLLLCETVSRSPARFDPREHHEYAVVMDDVWFRYTTAGPWVLRGHQLRIRRGEHFSLQGSSGLGKSTIMRLIAGLLVPERGSIRVFGRDPARHAGLCTYLPQEPALFSGTILSNLRTLSGAEHDRIMHAAEATGLRSWVDKLPMTFSTVLPPGGSNISGGQRQLVLLTAAVACDRPLMLLDESLAHLDRVTRAHLERSELFHGRTVVSVVHDV